MRDLAYAILVPALTNAGHAFIYFLAFVGSLHVLAKAIRKDQS